MIFKLKNPNIRTKSEFMAALLLLLLDGESFAFLHFYRNCAAHRNLIKFMQKKSWVQINQITRETKLVNERHENEEGYILLQRT